MQSVKAVTGTASGSAAIQNLTGWHITENHATTPAAATVHIRAGGATGPVIYEIEIEAGGDDKRSIDSPVDCQKVTGATSNIWYVEVVAGTVRWTLEGA